jgi:hypothetical protein
MKTLLIGIAALATSAMLFAVPPAAAQSVGIRASDNGVSVRIGDPPRRHYGWQRGKHYGWYNSRAQCRTVTVRERQWNGTVVVRKRTTC